MRYRITVNATTDYANADTDRETVETLTHLITYLIGMEWAEYADQNTPGALLVTDVAAGMLSGVPFGNAALELGLTITAL